MNQEVYIWGRNEGSGLGLEHKNDIHLPEKVNLSLLSKFRKYSLEVMRIIRSDVKDVSYNIRHSLLLTHDGELYSSGSNGSGQLGVGNYEDSDIYQKVDLPNVRKFVAGNSWSLAITHTNKLYIWGHGYGLGFKYKCCLPQITSIENVKDIIYVDYNLTLITTWLGDLYYLGSWYEKEYS